MQDLKIAFIQPDLAWENPQANRKSFDKKLESIQGKPDLIVLPETFNTGFPVDPQKFAEKENGSTMQWMKEKAAHTDAVVCGSILLEIGGRYHNSLIWMRPDGTHELYHKRHVFRMGGEHERVTPGKELLLTQLKGWNIRPLVCYDLRFPVWSKNTYKNQQFEYDFVFYIANWPAVRSYPWSQLLLARALENQAYVLGVNRVGTDGPGIDYSGDSALIDPKGQYIAKAGSGTESVIEATLSGDELHRFREKFNVGLDWDRFEIV